MNTYIFKDNQQTGPYEDSQIREALGAGTISYTDLGWREGLAEWQPLSALYPRQTPPQIPTSTPPQAIDLKPNAKQSKSLKSCPACGSQIAKSAKICSQCGKKLKMGCLPKLAIVIVVVIVIAIAAGGNNGGAGKNDNQPSTVATTEPESNITWNEIDAIYHLDKDSSIQSTTELQKKDAWKRYKGKRVTWSGTVTDVGETLGYLQLSIKMDADTLTSDLIITLKDSERQKALKLKDGDSVKFTGILDDWGTIMPISLDEGEILNNP